MEDKVYGGVIIQEGIFSGLNIKRIIETLRDIIKNNYLTNPGRANQMLKRVGLTQSRVRDFFNKYNVTELIAEKTGQNLSDVEKVERRFYRALRNRFGSEYDTLVHRMAQSLTLGSAIAEKEIDEAANDYMAEIKRKVSGIREGKQLLSESGRTAAVVAIFTVCINIGLLAYGHLAFGSVLMILINSFLVTAMLGSLFAKKESSGDQDYYYGG